MTLSNVWRIVGGLLLAAFVVIGGVAWLHEHDARLKAEAAQVAQQQIVSTAQKSIDAAKADTAKVAGDLKSRIAQLEAQKRQPVTAAQFVAGLGKAIPNLPQAATIATWPQTGAGLQVDQSTLPDAPGVMIPAVDLPALRDYKVNCDEAGARLTACALTAADTKIQTDGLETQLKATATERDEWKKAAKGGTWLHRTLTAAKWIGIGAASGYVAGHKW